MRLEERNHIITVLDFGVAHMQARQNVLPSGHVQREHVIAEGLNGLEILRLGTPTHISRGRSKTAIQLPINQGGQWRIQEDIVRNKVQNVFEIRTIAVKGLKRVV